MQTTSEEPFDNPVVSSYTDQSVLPGDHAPTIPNHMVNDDSTCHVSPSANVGLLSSPGSYQATTSTNIPYGAPSQLSVAESHVTQPSMASDYSASGDMTATLGHYTEPNAVYTILPSHGPSSCPLDLILLKFLKSRKEMLLNSMDPESVLGPRKPSTRAIINLEQVDTVHPLSGIMSRVLSTFSSVQMAEKLAFFYLMCHTMKV
jgi:hypothetical protein